ncbi:MAG: beta-phosphoglucomutase family hydrolase [Pseudomonadota bacterium]
MRIDKRAYDAVLFDLDGVLTATARLHAACWKRLFDDFLEQRAADLGEPFRPFDERQDYLAYVDGKPRYDGVRSFLASRGIAMDFGQPSDPPGDASMCALGNRKDALFDDRLRADGVETFDGAVRFATHMRLRKLNTAVVSSSRHCQAILDRAQLTPLFDVVVDGQVAENEGLTGKPAPDTFLLAARKLSVEPKRAVVVEDAIAGVQAGQAGGFGLVIGVDNLGQPERLKSNGATIVVADLAELL